MKKFTLMLLSLLMIIPLNLSGVYAESNNSDTFSETEIVDDEFKEFMDLCYSNMDSLTILQNDLDITEKAENIIVEKYNQGDYIALKEYIDSNDLDLSFVCENNSNPSSRSFSSKKFLRRVSKSKTVTDSYGVSREASWTVVLEIPFTYNDNTYKIANVYAPSLTLASTYVGYWFEPAQLCEVNTPIPTKIDDNNLLSYSVSYKINFRCDYLPFDEFTLGKYTISGTTGA